MLEAEMTSVHIQYRKYLIAGINNPERTRSVRRTKTADAYTYLVKHLIRWMEAKGERITRTTLLSYSTKYIPVARAGNGLFKNDANTVRAAVWYLHDWLAQRED